MNVPFKNAPRAATIALAATVGLTVLFAGCSPNGGGGGASNPTSVVPGTQPTDNGTGSVPVKVAVYIPTGDAGDTKDVLVHPVTGATSGSPARSAIRALAADPDSGFAAGTRLLSIKLKDAEADVDFNQLPVDANSGEGNQSKALNSILMTLGQFDTISTVQILVNGSPVKDVLQFPIDTPLDVIRPAQDKQADAAGGQAPG